MRRLCLFFAASLLLVPGACSTSKKSGNAASATGAPGGTPVIFEGAKAYGEEELRKAIADALEDYAERGLTAARADDAAFYLRMYYRKNGFSKATVEYELRGGTLVLHVREGPRALLRDIIFTGNRSIADSELWEYFLGATKKRLARQPELFPYSEVEIAAGIDRVRGLYISEGFLDVKVELGNVVFSENNTRTVVTVRIDENQRYTFGEVRFSGNTLYPREELLKAMGQPVNGPFSQTKLTHAQRDLQSFYKQHGFFKAEVAVAADPATAVNGRVSALFTVNAGARFRIGEIREQGLDRLRPSFIPKRFAHLQGKTYDPEKLDETYRELLRTGLFTNLRVSPTPDGPDELRLDVTVQEAKAREVGFTIGAGSYEGFLAGIRLGDRNLFGNGRPLTLAIDYSQRGLKGELLYVDPWLFDTRFSLRARIFSAQRVEEGYSKEEVGWRFDLSRRLFPHLELAAFIEQASVSITEATIDESLLGPTNYFVSSVGLTGSVDYRDDPLNPSRGWIFTGALDVSTIDGEAAFTRFTTRLSYYVPIGKCLLAFGARAGLMKPVNDIAEIPIDERYFSGGATTVRSFAERELGPKDRSGDPIGGEFFTVFNTEFTFPIVGALRGAVFVDAGNLAASDAPGVDNMRYAVGAGLRYALPIGPLRLDYGLNPSPRADEDRGAFHFSFGFAF